jgi:hypothetical protein
VPKRGFPDSHLKISTAILADELAGRQRRRQVDAFSSQRRQNGFGEILELIQSLCAEKVNT